jgi:hypothetical protein
VISGDADGVVAEVAAAVAMGHRGFIIPAFPPSGSWGEPRWEPLWAAIEQTGLAVCTTTWARGRTYLRRQVLATFLNDPAGSRRSRDGGT